MVRICTLVYLVFFSNSMSAQLWNFRLISTQAKYYKITSDSEYPFHYKFRLTNENDTSRIIKSNLVKSKISSLKINLVDDKNKPILNTRVMLTKPGFHNFEYPKSDLTGEYFFDNLQVLDSNILNYFYEISIADRIYKPFKEKVYLTTNQNIQYVIYLAKNPPKNVQILKSKRVLTPQKIRKLINRRFNKMNRFNHFLDKIFTRYKSYQFFIEI